MKKRKALFGVVLAGGLLFQGTCLTLNTDTLLSQGGDILCAVATSGFPGADHIDYCANVNIDLTQVFPQG